MLCEKKSVSFDPVQLIPWYGAVLAADPSLKSNPTIYQTAMKVAH